MDNRHITIQSQGKDAFELSMKLLFDNAPGGKATYYSEHPTYGFVLFWETESGVLSGAEDWSKKESDRVTSPIVKLPYPMNCKAATEMVWEWLAQQPDSKYLEYADHDGSNGHGFKVYNEYWGHVGDSHYAIGAILPIWAWYGK